MSRDQNDNLVTNENGNHVVRVDQDSDMTLEALFDAALKADGKKPRSVPYSMRKLPRSFFNPPMTGSKTGLQVNHQRSHSEPISHQRSSSEPAGLSAQAVVRAQQLPNHHLRQRSYDITAVDELGPLPPGWSQATTAEGQIYYLNHIERSTTWDDPRKSNVASRQQQQCRNFMIGDLHIHNQQDPFLSVVGVLPTTPAEHTRQESTDSGIGIPNHYSLPPTPQDFLGSLHIDDCMDGVGGT